MNTPIGADDWTEENKRDETPAERADRNFVEILQEFRVSQNGIQILFPILLSIPFTPIFGHLSALQQWFYLTSLLASAMGTVFFIAPVSIHRMLFRRGLKDEIVILASKLCQAGLAMLWLAMLSAVFVVVSFVFTLMISLIVVGVGAVVIFIFCYLIPLLYRRKLLRDDLTTPTATTILHLPSS